MIGAAEVKAGNVVRLDKEFHKIVEAVVHTGGGKAGSMVHLHLRNLSTGRVAERRFAPDDKLEDVPVDRVKMQFLYREGEAFHFMNPETYDQLPIPQNAIGPGAAFLKEGDEREVEFYEGKPLSILHPDAVELAVAATGAGLRGKSDSTLKEATLENGTQVLVPQFIKEGDLIRVEVETGKYLDRTTHREVKGAKFSVSAPKAGPKPETKGKG